MKKCIILCIGILGACYSLAQDPTVLCATELKADARVQILADKLVFDETKWQSLEVLSNKSKPTAKEKIALSVFAAESERCLELGADWRLKTYPAAINTLLSNFRVESVTALSDLYGDNTSYGEFARFRVKKMNELKNSIDAVNRELQVQEEILKKQREDALIKWTEKKNSEFQANRAIEQRQALAMQELEKSKQEQEEARNQALIKQSIDNLKSQLNTPNPYYKPLPTIQRPQTTNCIRYGNQVDCVTR
jgi:hypothetical protein